MDFINLLQNFHRFAARNIGLNKNGELAESKNNHYLNQNKIKKIPGKYERNDLSIWGIRKKKKKNSRRIRGIDLAFKNTKIRIRAQGEATS